MTNRPFWIQRIKNAWKERPIVWLSGVRRVGKTTLASMLSDALYMNCDLPSTARRLKDPELFYETLNRGATIIFDEIHRLDDPSSVLKIAADAYPHLKILATGSSTLAATKKFRDSLTGRKKLIYLPPVLWNECLDDFGLKNFDHRLLRGGLPEVLLSRHKNPLFFAEWIDSFYARDIQELFNIRQRTGFLKLLQFLFRQSAGLVDYTNLSHLSDMSRPTVKAHIEAMSIAHAVFVLPPFHGGGRREITHRPKIYAFDTGFVAFVKGWENIRESDRGYLWEHLVLDILRTATNSHNLYYWRDKSGCEIDFVVKRTEKQVDTVECKINPDSFDSKNLKTFRTLYPNGNNYVVVPFVKTPYRQRYNKLNVQFCSTSHIIRLIS